jgi:hypothetical protein
MLTPYCAVHAAACSLSTGSGRSRWAASAMSDNPAVRSTSTTCCLVSCTATTELSLLCEIAVSMLSSSPARGGAGRSCSAVEEDPLNQGSVARLVRLATVEIGTMVW